MLKMLTCDKFRIDPLTGVPIIINFTDGLNVVRGTEENKNSIGKSTILLLIDFALGGEDYGHNCNVALNKIGDHTIYFVIEHGGEEIYCSRSAKNPNIVTYYKDSYFKEELAQVTVAEYLGELARLYDLPEDFTFRQMVSPYIRVYPRQTTNERILINAAYSQPASSAIMDHLKLHGVYEDINSAIVERNQAEEKVKIYKKSAEFKYIRKITKEEYEKNLKEIEAKKAERDSILDDYREKKYDAKAARSIEVSSIAETLTYLETRKNEHIVRRKNLESLGKIDMEKFRASLEELKAFFPDVDFREIEKTEEFHSKIVTIFDQQTEKERRKIARDIKNIEEQIGIYKEKYKAINHIESMPETVIRKTCDYETDIRTMEDENKKYLENLSNKQLLDGLKDEVEKKSKEILAKLQQKINDGLSALNANFYNGKVRCPRIAFSGLDKRYSFYTPDDTGTGTSQKGVILFDIYTLQSTILPIAVHDTIILKHIEDVTMQEILKLYAKVTGKQIIIAYDGKKRLDEEANKILSESTRLELSGGEMALFGKEFNK